MLYCVIEWNTNSCETKYRDKALTVSSFILQNNEISILENRAFGRKKKRSSSFELVVTLTYAIEVFQIAVCHNNDYKRARTKRKTKTKGGN